jgi:hypothetical protein
MLYCVEPNSTNMTDQQLQLWSAEPHPTPPIYRELTTEARRLLIGQLARLILKQVQADHPQLPNAPPRHER